MVVVTPFEGGDGAGAEGTSAAAFGSDLSGFLAIPAAAAAAGCDGGRWDVDDEGDDDAGAWREAAKPAILFFLPLPSLTHSLYLFF